VCFVIYNLTRGALYGKQMCLRSLQICTSNNNLCFEETVYIVDRYLQTSSITHSENVFVETFPNEKIQSHR